MPGLNTSSAYDLSQLDYRSKKKSQKPQLKVVKNRRHISAPSLGSGVIYGFAIVVILVVLMVYNHVQLTELTSEISRLSKEMEVLQSENIRMTSALESTEKIQNIRTLALAMGMQKRDEFQTERIYLYSEDKIERSELVPQQGKSEAAKLVVVSMFSRFKEYLAPN